MGLPLQSAWGKEVIPLAFAILRQLKIPTYILFDGDAGIEDRLRAKDRVPESQREAQVKATAEKNRRLLRLCEYPEEGWPDRASVKAARTSAIALRMTSDELWPDLAKARDAVSREIGISSKVR